MLLNFLKIAVRNLTRQKSLAFINIFGLSLGIACFILLLLYSLNELSFDRFHSNERNIFAMYELRSGTDGNDQYDVAMALPMAPTFKKDFPDVVDFVRVKKSDEGMLVHFGNESRHLKIALADPGFFKFFNFPLESGSPENVLKDVNSMVLSSTTAREFFGNSNPIGKTIEVQVGPSFRPFVISAIANDQPSNSSIQFEALANLDFLQTTPMGEMMNHWYVSAFRTYIQLRPGSQLPHQLAKLEDFHHRYNDDGSTINKKTKKLITYGMAPIRSIHTDTRLDGMAEVSSINPTTIWIILAIATAVLLIACINFTTLAIGRSARRGKEVGVRKVAGAGKSQLIFQFLAESFLLSLLSMTIGFFLAKILLPQFNQLAGRSLEFSTIQYPELIWLLIALIFLVTLLSGGYPALLLSNFKLNEVLKNKIRMGGSNFFTRSLVTLQFALSIGLIISTIIILQQTKHLSDTYPGFNKQNVVVVDASDAGRTRFISLFKQRLAGNRDILGISASGASLGEGSDIDNHGFMYRNVHKKINEYAVDPDYMKVLGMQLVAGRNFDPTIGTDSTEAVIINEAMMNDFGWTTQNVIGQKVEGYTNDFSPVVIGVVKNFNFKSLSREIEPQLFHQFPQRGTKAIFVRLVPGNPSAAIAEIGRVWSQLVPGSPFTYNFLDEKLDSFYRSERRWSRIIGWAGGISILLACLGLFGLTALAAVNRVKEIGVRKVLGASVADITALLSKDFLKLVVLALLIASPIAWFFMGRWLETFAYRIHISWLVIALTGMAVIAIALLTTSFQTIKAAMTNPVKNLRDE